MYGIGGQRWRSPRSSNAQGVREKRGKRASRWARPFAGPLAGRKVCAARGPMALPISAFGARTRRALRNCLRAGRWQSGGVRLARGGGEMGLGACTAELLARGPMAIRWRAIGGDPSGRDAEGRAGGDPRVAATRKMRVVPMKRQECRFPEGRAALLRGRRLEWCRWGNTGAGRARNVCGAPRAAG